uniref:Shootin-1 n=1 Tax=Heterorhabditis bacteriophora TaxID=37862 RepID=A0A1I7X4G8_HETBA
MQETTYAGSDEKLKEKIRTTEALCDEIMEENEGLKAEVKDLQQEIEEMQDQYREEEIEEFRELQRELEQNAKNCRVLQFKLRKAERMKEQTETEKFQMQTKLNDLLANSSDTTIVSLRSDSARIKELESELRIAKEVSVRLHNELEQTEEKRYKLEDEVFYLKEKIREMQTQNKWREARNKTDNAVKRLSAELATSAPIIPDGEMSKELRDALEREIDSREQLRFAEEDLKRTQLRLQDVENENEVLMKKLSKSAKLRPPMVRSARILELETDYTKRAAETGVLSAGGEFKMTPEMERDMSKMIATISDLERKNLELNMQLKNTESKNFSYASSNASSNELRTEQEKRRVIEAELTELKQTMLKTDNQKLISLATKVSNIGLTSHVFTYVQVLQIEQLNSQLSMSNDRCTTLHKRMAKEGDTVKYMVRDIS